MLIEKVPETVAQRIAFVVNFVACARDFADVDHWQIAKQGAGRLIVDDLVIPRQNNGDGGKGDVMARLLDRT